MAESATQPGWDIKVTDSDGSLVELMSLKATDHAAYITHALERYPDIDVVSTSEVYAAMAGTPEGARLIDGGIDNVDLTTHVGDAAYGSGDGLVHAGLSFLALLPAAYKHFIASDKSAGDKTIGFTEQVSRGKFSAMAGKVAMLAVPYWPVALLASVGVSMVARVGDNRREQHDRLTQLLGSIRAESGRLFALRKAIQPLST